MPDQPVTHSEMQQMLIIAEKNAQHSESIANSLKSLADSIATLNGVKDDIKFSKWFIMSVGAVTIVATVLLRGLDNRNLFKEGVKSIVAEYAREQGLDTARADKEHSDEHHSAQVP